MHVKNGNSVSYWGMKMNFTKVKSNKKGIMLCLISWIVWVWLIMSLSIWITWIMVTKHTQEIIPIEVNENRYLSQVEKIKKPEFPCLVSVYLHKQKIIETIPLETYVKGVLVAEMPMEFELEALKAQAIAARTYIVQKLNEKELRGPQNDEKIITDTTAHQAYINQNELKERWENVHLQKYQGIIEKAIYETEDQILLFDKKPIHAVYFSTSNGYTENSEEYWIKAYPYLRSVKSHWDQHSSPRYKSMYKFMEEDLIHKLGLSHIHHDTNHELGIQVIERSRGNRITKIKIGGKIFSGREIRDHLGLASTHFDWEWSKNELKVTTYGFGHGVGMSQYGANAMAKEGKTALEILSYYYSGITIGKASNILSHVVNAG